MARDNKLRLEEELDELLLELEKLLVEEDERLDEELRDDELVALQVAALEVEDDELDDAAPPSPRGGSSITTFAPQLVASVAVTATSQPRWMTHLAVVPSFIAVLFLWTCTDGSMQPPLVATLSC